MIYFWVLGICVFIFKFVYYIWIYDNVDDNDNEDNDGNDEFND